MSLELRLIETNELTIEEKKELEVEIDSIIKKHNENTYKINELVFQSVTSLTTSQERISELESQGFFKRFWNNISGKNKNLELDINKNLAKAQYASQNLLQKLAEQNLMSFELITAINNKLNNSLLDINNELNDIYESLITFFKKTRSDIVYLENRIDRVEKNINLLNWVNSIEYQMYNGIDYLELNYVEKIVCIVRDFYEITRAEWTFSDILLLKSCIMNVGINVKDTVKSIDFVKEICTDGKLIDKLISNDFENVDINKDSYSPIIISILKYIKLQNEDNYVVKIIEDELKNSNINKSTDNISFSIVYKFIKDTKKVDLEDVKFAKLYNVETTDQVEARYILTTAFMDRINNLRRIFNSKDIRIFFENNKMTIAIRTIKDLFEIGDINCSIHDFKQVNQFYEEITTIISFIEYFKLTNRTGL